MKKLFAVVIFIINIAIAQNQFLFEKINNPTDIYINNEKLYIVDDKAEINIFELKDFSFISKFGKEGKGKGEFSIRPDHHVSLSFSDDKILVNSDGKISFYTKDGEFLSERKSIKSTFSYKLLDANFVSMASVSKEGINYFTHNIYCKNLTSQKEINSFYNDYQPGKGLAAFSIAWQYFTCNNEIYIHNKEKGANIDVFNSEGEIVRSLKWNYQPVKVQQYHRDGVYDHYRTSPYTKDRFEQLKALLKFPEYFSACRSWYVTDEKVYVFSYLIKDNKTELIILDKDGVFVKRIFVPFYQKGTDIDRVYPYAINNGKLYQLIKEQKTKLLITKLL